MEGEGLFLDLGLKLEGGARRHANADLAGIRIGETACNVMAAGRTGERQPGRGKADVEEDADGVLTPALSRPKRRFHSPFESKLAGKIAGCRRLNELQSPIEIGLAHAIGPNEHAEPVGGKADVTQRPVARGGNLADHQTHGGHHY